MEKNLRNIRTEFKEKGIFYTTNELAERLKKYVDFVPANIYDPTCGQGNLLSVFPPEIPKYGQEIYQDELDKAYEKLENFTGYCGDTLKDDGFKNLSFDLIIANPPFSIKWEPKSADERFMQADGILPPPSKADYAFMLHIISHLSKTGKAVVLEFPGILYRGQREGKIREWMIKQNLIERVVHIPGNTFVDTSIATCMIVLNKHKQTTDIVFEDSEIGEKRTVSQDEVKSNGYILSVSTYIQKIEKKEDVDPEALEDTARKLFLTRLRNELIFDRNVCRIEKRSMKPFLSDIRKIINDFEKEVYGE